MGGGIYGIFPTKKIDFYVGTNGQVLPGKYKSWIGVSKRENLLKKAKNDKLLNAIDSLYRPGSFIGDGGTATILKFEKRTGINVGRNGNSHLQKAIDMERYLKNRVLSENLSKSDRKLANKMLKKLRIAVVEFKKGATR